MENFTLLTSGGFAAQDLVMDGWTDIIGKLVTQLRDRSGGPDQDLASILEQADFEKMEQIRSRVDAIVGDPATAANLKPWYRQFCKRPCFHDEYLQAFNRPNVSLVDTDGRGVDAITPDGVLVGEHEFKVDCLIHATGFEVGTDYRDGPGTTSWVRTATDSPSIGRAECGPCTGCTCTAFPTCSSWVTPRVGSRSTTHTCSRRQQPPLPCTAPCHGPWPRDGGGDQ